MKHTIRQVKYLKALRPDLLYTSVATIGNRVFARARAKDGAPAYVEQQYTPFYYTPGDGSNAYDAVGYDGVDLIPTMCDSISEGKRFLEEMEEQGTPVYGNIQPEYMVLSDVYGSVDVEPDMDKLYIWFLDIEVDRDPVRGFAKIDDPFNPIVAITVIWQHMGQTGTVIYGTKDYIPKENELYLKCKSEDELLRCFLNDFSDGYDYPDIVTGWNVQFYDIPYLINRMKLLFAEENWIRFSPFERIQDRRVTLNGRDQTVMDVKGIAILDYYELYRKFTYTQQESYRLDHIAHVELGKRKLSYAEFRSLYRLYREDHQKFIEYNVRDVQLVVELDAKMRLIELVCALAYGAKANFADTFRQVRLWDIMIYHRLRKLGKQIPPRKDETKTEQYAGAYVKDPLVGLHNWVVSFDVASMYPHIIRQWNLSPETIRDRRHVGEWTVDDFLAKKVPTGFTLGCEHALAANGLETDRLQEGFLPNMLKTLYDERVRFKGLAKQYKGELEKTTDPARQAELRKKISAANNQQMVRKVNLNSAYGALGSAYFRFYDTHMAEAVTLTGQLTIRWVARDVNALLNRIFKTKEDYIIASDTDSIYVRMSAVVREWSKTHPDATKDQIVDMLDMICKKRIEPCIAQSLDELASYLNVATPCLSMVRESIADKGVWTAKKRYILNVFDSEGVRYAKPKLKIMGIEAIKSSTPAICRDMITHAMKLFMTGTQQDVWDYIAKSQLEFVGATFEDIAFPRSVNGLKKYSGRDKSVPIHVKGAIAFNEALVRTKLDKEYEPIHEGEKIRFAYLREPNPFHVHVMSAPEGCPPEWNIEKWLDYDTMFEKALVEPLEAILSCAGWTTQKVASLFD